MVKPGGRLVGRSLREWTTRSTLGGQTGNSHTGPLFSCERTSEALKSKRAFKEERLNSKMKAKDRERGESQPVEQRATHSFLSRAFSSSLVNKLFSPICIKNKQWDISDTFIFTSSRLLHYLISVRNAALPLIKLCRGFYPQWLTWQLEQEFHQLKLKKTTKQAL